MSFKSNKYLVIKNAIDSNIASLLYKYLLNKRKVAKKYFEVNYISQFNSDYGVWNDDQVPNTYSVYGDIMMDTLLQDIQEKIEKNISIKLYPTYSYARVYKQGDILERHKDRPSCEISATLNLGGDVWSIFLQSKNKQEIVLESGDLLIYSGCELEHWREEFTGTDCGQVFLHYNKYKSKEENINLYDGRPFLGLPNWFKQNKSEVENG
jgi:hypothetical protein|tara:strand:- start:529 stop:1155 length:627 start_codon:yes stop_codon:yes gene_type:complete